MKITESRELHHYSKLAVQCEREELPQYAGLCWIAAARCEGSLGNSPGEAWDLVRGARQFLVAETSSRALGCPSPGGENLQLALQCIMGQHTASELLLKQIPLSIFGELVTQALDWPADYTRPKEDGMDMYEDGKREKTIENDGGEVYGGEGGGRPRGRSRNRWEGEIAEKVQVRGEEFRWQHHHTAEQGGSSSCPLSAGLALELGQALRVDLDRPEEAASQFRLAADLQAACPLEQLNNLGLLTSCKIHLGDYDGALSVFNEMVSVAEHGGRPPVGVYADILRRCEVTRVLLLLILQPSAQRLPVEGAGPPLVSMRTSYGVVKSPGCYFS
uniref:Uncharacterized protein n=1 Tax=Timema cristinae TaxID=61476 RepID=A0A7R9H4T1_TIMCR|nr:unnamed protein product [Timema cristinae]